MSGAQAPTSADVAVQLAHLSGTVQGWQEMTDRRLTTVERDQRDLRLDVDTLKGSESERTGRTGLLVAAASLGTGTVTIFGAPLVAQLLG